ncbi:MAG: hypothetical protein K0S37_2992 [Microbacterium sp.]|jgi:hypothetical protein|nr:hypothetical protein [Microbacterium sp.]
MGDRELTPALPLDLRQQLNFDLRDPQLAALDDNARFIVRRLVGRAYQRGYDNGWTAGQNDADAELAIARDRG